MRTKKTVVILISGKAGSGKTTVKDLLVPKLRDIPAMEVFPYSFANPIKFIAQRFGKWNKSKDDAGRKFLQGIGQVFREYNPDIWIIHFLEQLDSSSMVFPPNFAVIDDWRFPNEWTYLQTNPMLSVVTVRVTGRGGLDGDTASDVSETSLTDEGAYDFIIENSGTLEDLERQVDTVLSEISKQYIVE